MRNRIYIKDLKEHIGKEVIIAGWVDVRRDQGKMIFFDMRDMTGKVQCVALPSKNFPSKNFPAFALGDKGQGTHGFLNSSPESLVKEIRPEWVLKITGKVNKRPEKNIKAEVLNGDLELEVTQIEVLNKAETTPFQITESTIGINEDLRMKYKYLDLRTERMQKNIRMRDEDTRGDRQLEFTQLDFEISFVTQEEVLEYTEAMFIELVKNVYPEKKISKIPFPRISYAESMKKYGSDKPDMRVNKNDPNELAFVWVLDFPMFEKTKEGELQAVHHPFCSIKEEDKEKFIKGEDMFSIRANAYDLVLNSYELSSGSIRIHERAIQKQVFDLLKISEEEQQKRFGHMLEAFTFGAPPHGGFAPGIDRIVMILQNEPNIREVIAFPKTGEGRDLMMGSPASITDKQLKELGIKLVK